MQATHARSAGYGLASGRERKLASCLDRNPPGLGDLRGDDREVGGGEVEDFCLDDAAGLVGGRGAEPAKICGRSCRNQADFLEQFAV